MNDPVKESSNESHFCDVCSLEYTSENELKEHSWSLLHHKKLDKEKGRDYVHNCGLCNENIFGLLAFTKHLHGDDHLKKLHEWKAQNAPVNEQVFVREESPYQPFSSNMQQMRPHGNINPPVMHQSYGNSRPRFVPHFNQRNFNPNFVPIRPRFPNMIWTQPMEYFPQNSQRFYSGPVRLSSRLPPHPIVTLNLQEADYSRQYKFINVHPQRFVSSKNSSVNANENQGRPRSESQPEPLKLDAEKSKATLKEFIENRTEIGKDKEERDNSFKGFEATRLMRQRMKEITERRSRQVTQLPKQLPVSHLNVKSSEVLAQPETGQVASSPRDAVADITRSFEVLSRENIEAQESVPKTSGTEETSKQDDGKNDWNMERGKTLDCPFVGSNEEQELANFVAENLWSAKESNSLAAVREIADKSQSVNDNGSQKVRVMQQESEGAITRTERDAMPMNSMGLLKSLSATAEGQSNSNISTEGPKICSGIQTMLLDNGVRVIYTVPVDKIGNQSSPIKSNIKIVNVNEAEIHRETRIHISDSNYKKNHQKHGPVSMQLPTESMESSTGTETQPAAKVVTTTRKDNTLGQGATKVIASTRKEGGSAQGAAKVIGTTRKEGGSAQGAAKVISTTRKEGSLAQEAAKVIATTTKESGSAQGAAKVIATTTKESGSAKGAAKVISTTRKEGSLAQEAAKVIATTTKEGGSAQEAAKVIATTRKECSLAQGVTNNVRATDYLSTSNSTEVTSTLTNHSNEHREQVDKDNSLNKSIQQDEQPSDGNISLESSIVSLDESLMSANLSNQCEFRYQDGRRCPTSASHKFCKYHEKVVRDVFIHLARGTAVQKSQADAATSQQINQPSSRQAEVSWPAVTSTTSSVSTQVSQTPTTSVSSHAEKDLQYLPFETSSTVSVVELENTEDNGEHISLQSRFKYLHKATKNPLSGIELSRTNLPPAIRKMLSKKYGTERKSDGEDETTSSSLEKDKVLSPDSLVRQPQHLRSSAESTVVASSDRPRMATFERNASTPYPVTTECSIPVAPVPNLHNATSGSPDASITRQSLGNFENVSSTHSIPVSKKTSLTNLHFHESHISSVIESAHSQSRNLFSIASSQLHSAPKPVTVSTTFSTDKRPAMSNLPVESSDLLSKVKDFLSSSGSQVLYSSARHSVKAKIVQHASEMQSAEATIIARASDRQSKGSNVVSCVPESPSSISTVVSRASERQFTESTIVSRASDRQSTGSTIVSRASKLQNTGSTIVSRASVRQSTGSTIASRASPRQSTENTIVSHASELQPRRTATVSRTPIGQAIGMTSVSHASERSLTEKAIIRPSIAHIAKPLINQTTKSVAIPTKSIQAVTITKPAGQPSSNSTASLDFVSPDTCTCASINIPSATIGIINANVVASTLDTLPSFRVNFEKGSNRKTSNAETVANYTSDAGRSRSSDMQIDSRRQSTSLNGPEKPLPVTSSSLYQSTENPVVKSPGSCLAPQTNHADHSKDFILEAIVTSVDSASVFKQTEALATKATTTCSTIVSEQAAESLHLAAKPLEIQAKQRNLLRSFFDNFQKKREGHSNKTAEISVSFGGTDSHETQMGRREKYYDVSQMGLKKKNVKRKKDGKECVERKRPRLEKAQIVNIEKYAHLDKKKKAIKKSLSFATTNVRKLRAQIDSLRTKLASWEELETSCFTQMTKISQKQQRVLSFLGKSEKDIGSMIEEYHANRDIGSDAGGSAINKDRMDRNMNIVKEKDTRKGITSLNTSACGNSDDITIVDDSEISTEINISCSKSSTGSPSLTDDVFAFNSEDDIVYQNKNSLLQKSKSTCPIKIKKSKKQKDIRSSSSLSEDIRLDRASYRPNNKSTTKANSPTKFLRNKNGRRSPRVQLEDISLLLKKDNKKSGSKKSNNFKQYVSPIAALKVRLGSKSSSGTDDGGRGRKQSAGQDLEINFDASKSRKRSSSNTSERESGVGSDDVVSTKRVGDKSEIKKNGVQTGKSDSFSKETPCTKTVSITSQNDRSNENSTSVQLIENAASVDRLVPGSVNEEGQHVPQSVPSQNVPQNVAQKTNIKHSTPNSFVEKPHFRSASSTSQRNMTSSGNNMLEKNRYTSQNVLKKSNIGPHISEGQQTPHSSIEKSNLTPGHNIAQRSSISSCQGKFAATKHNTQNMPQKCATGHQTQNPSFNRPHFSSENSFSRGSTSSSDQEIHQKTKCRTQNLPQKSTVGQQTLTSSVTKPHVSSGSNTTRRHPWYYDQEMPETPQYETNGVTQKSAYGKPTTNMLVKDPHLDSCSGSVNITTASFHQRAKREFGEASSFNKDNANAFSKAHQIHDRRLSLTTPSSETSHVGDLGRKRKRSDNDNVNTSALQSKVAKKVHEMGKGNKSREPSVGPDFSESVPRETNSPTGPGIVDNGTNKQLKVLRYNLLAGKNTTSLHPAYYASLGQGGEEGKVYTPHSLAVTGLLVYKGFMYSCSLDKTIRIHDTKSALCMRAFLQLRKGVNCMELNSRDKRPTLFAGCNDGRLLFYDFYNLQMQHSVRNQGRVLTLHLAFGFLYAGLHNGMLTMFDLRRKEIINKLTLTEGAPVKAIKSTILCHAGIELHRLLIVLVGNAIKILNMQALFSVKNLQEDYVTNILCMEVLKKRLFLGDGQGSVNVHDLEDLRFLKLFCRQQNSGAITSIKVAGELLITASFDQLIRCYDLNNGQLMQVYGGHKTIIYSLAVESGQQATIYSGSDDGEIRSIDVDLTRFTRCQWENCRLPFGALSHLKLHVLNHHIKPNVNEFRCKWMSCKHIYPTCVRNENIDVDIKHVEGHLQEQKEGS